MSRLWLYVTALLCFLRPIAGISGSNLPKKKFSWDRTKYVYAFGDSYTYVEGKAGRPAFSFIGDMLNYSFTPEELLANEIVPNATSSGGSNWPEFLTGCFEGSPLGCAKQLWNFAFAGADIDAALLPLHHDYTVPLVDQVKQWIAYVSRVIKHPSDETLTLWWIGINDTGDTVNNKTITDFEAFWEIEMKSYFQAVQSAYSHGLHAHLFLNVPATDRAPATVGNTTAAAIKKENIRLYNEVLTRHVDAFQRTNQGSTVLTFDTNAWFNEALDNAASRGFTNITGFCSCTDPGYFWWNSGHPTELVHRQLAQAIDQKLKQETCI